jgi:hypothetical protein
MKITNGTSIFVGIIILALSITIGWDYLKFKLIEKTHRYTIGTVTLFKSYARETNNRIEYYYNVDGKRYEGKFRSSSLNKNLEGKKILIEFSTSVKRFNQPIYTTIIADSINVPESGWQTIPDFIQ